MALPAVGGDVWVDVSGDSALNECVTLTYPALDECRWEERLTEDEDAGFMSLRGACRILCRKTDWMWAWESLIGKNLHVDYKNRDRLTVLFEIMKKYIAKEKKVFLSVFLKPKSKNS